jgi:hypothetical protein
MKTLTQHNIIVKPSVVHGYGVFATKDIPKNTLIEECYCIITDNVDPCFENYYFAFGEKNTLPLGFGLIYNHAPHPKTTFDFNEAKKLMIIRSTQHIRAHEEIFISYGKDWFDARKIPVKRISSSQRFLNYLMGMPARAVIALSGLLITIYLMNALTATQQTQKNLQTLSMTTQQARDA